MSEHTEIPGVQICPSRSNNLDATEPDTSTTSHPTDNTMNTRYFRPETGFFLLAWTVCLWGLRENGFYDPGCLWHIVVGDLILDSGFPRTDPFSYTFAGKPWIPQQWGAEVILAIGHRLGGFDTLLLGLATILAGFWTWVFAKMRDGGMGIPLAGGMVAAAAITGAYHYFARPHLATIVLLGWVMGCIVDYERGRVSTWRLVGLIPLCVIWTNLHGGVLAGVFTLGLAVGGWSLVAMSRRLRETGISRPDRDVPASSLRQTGLLWGIVVACLLTPFVNPFGMEMLRTWQRIVGSPVMARVVNEHMPLDPTHPAGQAVIGFGALYLAALAGTFPMRPRVSWLIPLVWFALSIKGIRQGPLFAVTAAVALADIWPHTIWYRWLREHGDSLAVEPRPDGVQIGGGAMLLPGFLVMALFALQMLGLRGLAYLDDRMIPVDLVPALRIELAKLAPDRRIYNDCNLGGFLIYHFPDRKVFMDDRFELYGDDWTSDYADAIWNRPGQVDIWADQYGCDLILVPYGKGAAPVAEHLETRSQRWQEVARGRRAVLFKRKPGW